MGDYGVRKYEVDDGRFMSVDPLWEKYRGWSPYQYCRNNPVLLIDPSGFGDYYNEGGFFGSDGIDDCKKYAVPLGGSFDIEGVLDESGNIDYSKLRDISIEYPSEDVRRQITELIFDPISRANSREDAGAIGLDIEGNQHFEYGGRGPEARLNEPASSSKQVEAAIAALNENGYAPTTFVHSHPFPKQIGHSKGFVQTPSNPEDYAAAVNLRLLGILVTSEKIYFFRRKILAEVPVSSFVVGK